MTIITAKKADCDIRYVNFFLQHPIIVIKIDDADVYYEIAKQEVIILKILKTIVSAIAWTLILGGVLVFLVTVAYNHNTLQIIFSDPIVQASLTILVRLLYCVGAILIGLIFLTIAVKIGFSIRSKEREQKKIEAKRRKEEKWEEEKEELLKDVDEEGM